MSGPSMKPMISIEEEDAIKRILAHHDLRNPRLFKQLSALLEWVRQDERSKSGFDHRNRPPIMLALLSSIGVYGREVIGPTPSMEPLKEEPDVPPPTPTP